MNLNKFIQLKIFSRLITLYSVTLLCFLAISYYGVEKETKRYFTMTNGYITSSTQQLVNEGEYIRVQMNIEQFTKKINENADFKICPQVYMDSLLISSIECTGYFSKRISASQTLNNSKHLKIDMRIDYDTFIFSTLLKILIFSLFSFIAFIFIKKSIDHFTTQITTPLQKWSNWAQNLSFNEDLNPPNFTNEELNIQEFKNFNEFTQKAFLLQKDFYTLKISEEKSQAISDLAKEVSHDIRSPLTALRMSIEDTKNIPKEQRHMIKASFQRINDIANNLLNYKTLSPTSEHQLKTELIAPIIDSIISEKRLSYRAKINIQIEADLKDSYALFTLINPVELKRVLSNLINNSVEAMDTDGKITVHAKDFDHERILLTVTDNGKGIPEDILLKLGEKGLSHGKEHLDSGHGLGFAHAKKTIESFGGSLVVESTVNMGTIISIFLKKSSPPSWFIKELNIPEDTAVFILDDDQSILKAWSEKLPVTLHLFSTEEEFLLKMRDLKSDKYIVLMDYEFSGHTRNGLDVIESLRSEKNSILVTSYSDDDAIIERCMELGVGLIPKAMIPFIPIQAKTLSKNTHFDYVYIDDDKIMLKGWKRRADQKNISLLTLETSDNFDHYSDKIDKESTCIYIDSDLGESKMRGEDFAQILHDKGYKKIYIASGYEAQYFSHLPWLIYSGKDCPF